MGKYLNSSDADRKFERLNTATSEVVLRELSYLEREREIGFPERLFEYESDHNHAWYLLGLSYEKKGDREQAAWCFRVAIEIFPEDADSYVAYSNLEDNLDALYPILERGVSITNDDRVRLNLGNTYLDLKNPELALKHLADISTGVDYYSDVEVSLDKAKNLSA